jgi:hypothetical protein
MLRFTSAEWTLRRPLQRIDVDVQGSEITS